ncbi:MAG: cyclic pyranopterin monophosphate synthase MoaC [Rickettsiales bacterium]|nr:cyclic pyranopterin monophosphate synthase MoaC [Rickettsiales bacterium]|tara:strand:+ start:2256 stop:2741 length:486 start_codon:yes stop_codon:yes gene_type:complete
MTDELTHLDQDGAARMVDVGGKQVTSRRALARGRVAMSEKALQAAVRGSRKGDVLQVARIAGIMAAKKTAELIPLCHPLLLNSVAVTLEVDEAGSCVTIEASVSIAGRTGVEMEALTAVSVAALTVYDMLKSVDQAMVIEGISLVEKEGGRSGSYRRTEGG